MYYRYRLYDPNKGRFLSLDPIGFADGPNRYIYLVNDPLDYVDPTGLSVLALPWPGAGMGMGAGMGGATGVGVMGGVAPICATAYGGWTLGWTLGKLIDEHTGASDALGDMIADVIIFLNYGGHGKGERGHAAKSGGTPNEWKHRKPHPTDPDKIIEIDPQTGKKIIKKKPPNCPW